MYRNLFVVFLFLCFGFTQAQVNVYQITNTLSVSEKHGFVYALPRTVFQVNVTVLKTEHFAGPYAQYAAKYLDLENVVSGDYNEYTIINVDLSTFAEPDPEHYYFVEFDEKTTKEEVSSFITMSESGLIMGLQEKPLKSSDKVVNIQSEDVYSGLFKYFAETNLVESFDTVIKKVVVDTLTVEKVYYNRKWVEKSDEQKAVEAANMINKIRESRFNLLTGYHEVAFDAGSITYMDKELQSLEKEYLSLFTGVGVISKLKFSYTVYPKTGDDSMQLPVFSFSDRTGVKDVNTAGGEKIHIKIEEVNLSPQVEALAKSREESSKNGRGYYYRIPATAVVSLEIDNDLKVQKSVSIAQLGVTTYLPSSIINVEFHQTGSIKSIIQ